MKNNVPIVTGLLGVASLAFVSSGLMAPIHPAIVGLIGSIGGSITSNFLCELSPQRMKSWFIKTHPDDLNHSVKKLFFRSIHEALSNILVLYSETDVDKAELKAAKRIVNLLKKESPDYLFNSRLEIEDNEISEFLHNSDDDKITELLLKQFESLGASPSFSSFLSEHFPFQVQLCFGEGLKNPANHDAWVAFQRMITEEMQRTLTQIEQNQQEIRKDISGISAGNGLSEEEITEMRKLREILSDKKLIKVNIEESISTSLQTIEDKENELIRITTKTNLTVNKIKQIVIRIEKQNQSYKMMLTLLVILLVLACGALTYFTITSSFTATIQVYGWKGKDHHPLQGNGEIKILLGDKIERAEINKQGEAIFKKIPFTYKNEKVRISLAETQGEPYYLVDSLVKIEKNNPSCVQVKLTGIDKLTGEILDEVSGNGLADATVIMAGIEVKTDNRGEFELLVPEDKQELEQEITVWKEGYKTYRKTALPMMGNSKFRIILQTQ